MTAKERQTLRQTGKNGSYKNKHTIKGWQPRWNSQIYNPDMLNMSKHQWVTTSLHNIYILYSPSKFNFALQLQMSQGQVASDYYSQTHRGPRQTCQLHNHACYTYYCTDTVLSKSTQILYTHTYKYKGTLLFVINT